jgi:hypothetical protein
LSSAYSRAAFLRTPKHNQTRGRVMAHTRVRAHAHTPTHPHASAHARCTHSHTHTSKQTKHTHRHARAHAHTHSLARAHSHTHTQTRARTNDREIPTQRGWVARGLAAPSRAPLQAPPRKLDGPRTLDRSPRRRPRHARPAAARRRPSPTARPRAGACPCRRSRSGASVAECLHASVGHRTAALPVVRRLPGRPTAGERG